MSKPVSRRQFLLGKFAGITLSALFMTALMGWVLVWVFLYKSWYDSGVAGAVNIGDDSEVRQRLLDLLLRVLQIRADAHIGDGHLSRYAARVKPPRAVIAATTVRCG